MIRTTVALALLVLDCAAKECTKENVFTGSGVDLSGCDQLDLSYADVNGKRLTMLSAALEENKQLHQIILSGNGIDDAGVVSLAAALKSTMVQTLGLAQNAIGDDGAKALAELLSNSGTLQRLAIGINSIGDEGAVALAAALENNSVLNRLYLQRNDVGEAGANALIAAVKRARLRGFTALDTLLLIQNARVGGATLDKVEKTLHTPPTPQIASRDEL